MAIDVATADKRPVRRGPSTAFDRRVIVLRAIRLLRDRGFRNDEIAVVVGMTERHVRNKVRLLQRCAESTGCA